MDGNPLGLPAVRADAGYYAVPDPDDPWRMTSWHVDGKGLLHRYPGHRWEPLPPEFAGNADERRDARDDWYQTTYRDWKVAVIDAISAGPADASDAFDDMYPDKAPYLRENLVPLKTRAQRLAENMLAAVLRDELSISEVARRTGVARSTVRARVRAAVKTAATDPQRARVALAQSVPLLPRELLPTDQAVTPVDLDALVARVAETRGAGARRQVSASAAYEELIRRVAERCSKD